MIRKISGGDKKIIRFNVLIFNESYGNEQFDEDILLF